MHFLRQGVQAATPGQTRLARLFIHAFTLLKAMRNMMLMRRVGGGYRFRHNLVHSYFAEHGVPMTETTA